MNRRNDNDVCYHLGVYYGRLFAPTEIKSEKHLLKPIPFLSAFE